MEEYVGELWHKLITRAADNQFPAAAIKLTDIQKSLSIFFRALGGDGGLQIEVADATPNPGRRSLLQRIAGSQAKIQLAWRDERALKLPPNIAWFEHTELNKDLYYWLACLAAMTKSNRVCSDRQHWMRHNQQMTLAAFKLFPGIRGRYQRLVEAHLSQRQRGYQLKPTEIQAEKCIQQALKQPGSITHLPEGRYYPAPVPLWLHPTPPCSPQSSTVVDTDDEAESKPSHELEDMGRRQAERVEEPDPDRGLVTVRMENIFTMGAFVNVDRGTEDEEDVERAKNIARELDKLSVTHNGKASRTRLRFDLDLPSGEADDIILSDGILLPEWDWKKQKLLPDRCRIVSMMAKNALPCALPSHLNRTARRLRNQFQSMAPAKTWHYAQTDGQDIDLDAYMRYRSERMAGHRVGTENLYREMRSGARDLACLLLADLSLSTDTYINNTHRVIDVIRDSLYLFAESLSATGDRFSMLGFSSRKRDPVRVHTIKSFSENYNAGIRGRISAIKPGYYTRLGAAIRYASQRLSAEGNGRRLLLILTDGKPNDLDQYEGRYGIEDTRQAIVSARRSGLLPFCITIDKKANDYLPYLFGQNSYIVIHQPEKLPRALPRLYSQLTQ